MGSERRLWSITRDRLVNVVEELGFPKVLGEAAARHLGSPRAMERLIVYLENVRPDKEELVIDEMLSIRDQIDAWRERKESREAARKYNEILYFGLEGAGEDPGDEYFAEEDFDGED